jgi:hypothetical protein
LFNFVATDDRIDVNNKQLNIRNVKLDFNCIMMKTSIPIGTANCKKLTFECETDEVLEGTSFVYHSILIDSEKNGVDVIVGTFIVKDAVSSNGIVSVVAYDLMFIGNKPYTTALTFPKTINEILAEVCTNMGVTLESGLTLVNGAYSVASNPFISGETYRDVLAYIAEINGCIAYTYFNEDYGDLLTFVTPADAEAVAEAIPEQYVEMPLQAQTQAINTVIIKDSLRGESTTDGDSSGGILLIEDNPFAADQTAREALITGVASTVSGLTYRPFIARGIADPRLKPCDPIRLFDNNYTESESYVVAMNYSSVYTVSNSTVRFSKNDISAPAKAQCAVEYEAPKPKAERQAIRAFNVASGAQSSANGKNTIYYSATEPTGGINGDVWFDTANGNRVNIYQDGWTAVQYGTAAFAANSITAASGIIADIDAAKITTGIISGIQAIFGGSEDTALTVKDAEENIIATVDKDGILINSPSQEVGVTADTPFRIKHSDIDDVITVFGVTRIASNVMHSFIDISGYFGFDPSKVFLRLRSNGQITHIDNYSGKTNVLTVSTDDLQYNGEAMATKTYVGTNIKQTGQNNILVENTLESASTTLYSDNFALSDGDCAEIEIYALSNSDNTTCNTTLAFNGDTADNTKYKGWYRYGVGAPTYYTATPVVGHAYSNTMPNITKAKIAVVNGYVLVQGSGVRGRSSDYNEDYIWYRLTQGDITSIQIISSSSLKAGSYVRIRKTTNNLAM